MSIILKNISLKKYNSFGIEVKAKHFASFSSIQELKNILEAYRQEADHKSTEVLLLGGGSNVLFTDDVNALVLKNEIKEIDIIKEEADHVYVKVGAGENWHQFVSYCLQHNLAGVENLALIPGSVGAAPIQNIGAYGVELKDVFYALDAVHLNTHAVQSFTNNDCAFGYRDSVFKHKEKNKFAICYVYFKLNKKPHFHIGYGAIKQELEKNFGNQLTIQNVAKAVINIRQSKLPNPTELGNAGSFFKNPEVPAQQYEALKIKFPDLIGFLLPNQNYKLAAGWLIEQCGPKNGVGWKGYRDADAGCYPLQALVLVNYGAATGKDILNLANKIIASVQKKFGVLLQMEVNVYR